MVYDATVYGSAIPMVGPTGGFSAGVPMMDAGIGMLPPSNPFPTPDPMAGFPQYQQAGGSPWMPLMQAGASLLSSGGRDFGGALGAFGQGMMQQDALERQKAQDRYRQDMDRWKVGRDVERQETLDERYEAQQEESRRRWDIGQQQREDEIARADEKEAEGLARRRAAAEETAAAIGGIDQAQFKSVAALEAAIDRRQAELDRQSQFKYWESQERLRQEGREDKTTRRSFTNSDINSLANSLGDEGGMGTRDETTGKWQPASYDERRKAAIEILSRETGAVAPAGGEGGGLPPGLQGFVATLSQMPPVVAARQIEQGVKDGDLTADQADALRKAIGLQ